MKKLFALILAVVMICTMSVSVFATTEHLIGNGKNGTTDNDSYTDGLAADQDFPSSLQGYEVNITAEVGQVQHRYAVDITYDVMSFEIAGATLVWNVNTLKYDVLGSGTIPTDQKFNVTVTNYSDLGVNLTVLVTDGIDDGATVAAYQDETATALGTGPIEIDDAINGAANFAFDVKVTSTNWDNVVKYYADYFTANSSQTSAIMGTMSITLAKLAGATPSAPAGTP